MTEIQFFDVEKFVPLMKQYINDKSPHIRRLLISWIDVMDNVPGLDILDFLPEFLDGLFDMLSDPHREIRQVGCIDSVPSRKLMPFFVHFYQKSKNRILVMSISTR